MSIRKEQKMKLSFNLINKKCINFPLIFKSSRNKYYFIILLCFKLKITKNDI